MSYTTTEDELHEIQAIANLKDYRMETYIDDKLIDTWEFETLDEMIHEGLLDMSFDQLIGNADYIVDEWECNIREEDLAVRLTVFISEVDPYHFADSLENGEGIISAITKTRKYLRDPECIRKMIEGLQEIAKECSLENADLYKCYDLMYDLRHVYNYSFSVPVYDRETVILEDIFNAVGLKFTIEFDEAGLKITDGKQTWHNECFFQWFNENVLTIEKCRELEQTHFNVYADYKDLSEHNGVRVGTRIRSKEEREER